MNHLIISREYPPAPYAHGGIGTYVQQIARLLAERGETVYVIAEQWDRAPLAIERLHDGRLIVHRVPLSRPRALLPGERHPADVTEILEAMAASEFPAHGFSWQAALLAETLVETAGIDVIEAQEFEAPLYYFLLRRSVGLGPTRQPPCLVHLHGPWELVCQYNEWGLSSAYDLTVARLEAHTIRAADGLLCPSQYLANQVVSLYGVARDTIERIPYPIGDTPVVDRAPEIWRRGAILYVGRMEPRKGVLEWIDAAVAMAQERPDLRFEFVGADTTLNGQDGGPSVRAEVERRVPPDLAHAFAFHDAEPRPALWARLARAQLVVVPSRWDNFPNTAIEAMCSGLPVLASPEGGIAEVIEDGRTGWLAASNRPDDLLATLRRALDTPYEGRSRMGRTAAEAIRARCDNVVTVERHLDFRRRVATVGATRSLSVPESGLAAVGEDTRDAATASSRPGSNPPEGRGLAIVVTDVDDGGLGACLSSVAGQTCPPVEVVVVTGKNEPAQEAWSRPVLEQRGWRVIEGAGLSLSDRRDVAMRALIERADAPLGVTVTESSCRLAPDFVESCLRTLEREPKVGVVSSWFSEGGPSHRTRIRPAPAWPCQWIMDDVAASSTMRVDALREAGWVRQVLGGEASQADLALAMLADGWRAVTYPALLSWQVSATRPEAIALAQAASARLRAAFRDQWPRPTAPALAALNRLLESHPTGPPESGRSARGSFTPQGVLRQSLAAQLQLVGRALRNPRYAAAWIGWHSRQAWRGALKRFGRSSAI